MSIRTFVIFECVYKVNSLKAKRVYVFSSDEMFRFFTFIIVAFHPSNVRVVTIIFMYI